MSVLEYVKQGRQEMYEEVMYLLKHLDHNMSRKELIDRVSELKERESD